MPLTIVSNFAADVAQRQLAQSNDRASSSIAKLSSGTRVLAARDDAAALAIGSRLRADVAAIQQASVNAGQAISLLQIADGALSQINDTLIRLNSLSVQAGSDQLGSTERGLIDTEFQQLLSEVQRISEDTEFNGQQLISGGVLSQLVSASDSGTNGVSSISFDNSVQNEEVFQYSYNATGEILTVTKLAVDGATLNTATPIASTNFTENNISVAFDASVNSDAVYTYSYAQATEQLTLTDINTGESSVVDITNAFNAAFGSSQNVVGANESLAINFQDQGVTITLGENFDRTNALTVTNIASTADADADGNNINAGGVTGTTVATSGATRTAIDVLTGLTDANATYDAAAGTLSLILDASVADTLSLNGGNTITVAGVGDFVFNGNVAETADGTTQSFTLDFNGVSLFTVAHDIDIAAGNDNQIEVTVTVDDIFNNVQTNTSGTDESVQLDLTSDLDAIAGTGNNLGFGETLGVSVGQFGVSLTLDNSFDRTSNITTTTGTVTENSLNVATSSFAASSGFLNADVYDALLGLSVNATTGVGYDAITGILSLQVRETTNAVTLDGVSGLRFDNGVDGEATADLVGAGTTTEVGLVLADGSTVDIGTLTATYTNGQPDGATGLVNIQLGAGVFYNSVDQNALTSDFTFKVGTGNESFDRITISVNSVTLQALGINGTDVTTSASADAASVAIGNSINALNSARANIGAFQNRLDIAAANLATTEENTEAARSALLDLNVASEITKFTSRQILVQAGVSALAQANQLPQNLLRLFQ